MSDLQKALDSQLRNIQKRTGKTLEELSAIVAGSGLTKHAEIRAMLKRELGMGHGDANTLVHFVRESAKSATSAKPANSDEVLDAIYVGPKAELRPIHEKLMAALSKFGTFETAPKKTYVSLRRKKQFAMIGPATNTRVDVGLNMKGVSATTRLLELPPGGMCQYKVRLSEVKEVDKELIAWIKQAYDAAS